MSSNLKTAPAIKPARDRARRPTNDRRHSPVRYRPDRVPLRPTELDIEDLIPNEDDPQWGSTAVIDDEFDELGEELCTLVGHTPDLLDDDADNWPAT